MSRDDEVVDATEARQPNGPVGVVERRAECEREAGDRPDQERGDSCEERKGDRVRRQHQKECEGRAKAARLPKSQLDDAAASVSSRRPSSQLRQQIKESHQSSIKVLHWSGSLEPRSAATTVRMPSCHGSQFPLLRERTKTDEGKAHLTNILARRLTGHVVGYPELRECLKRGAAGCD